MGLTKRSDSYYVEFRVTEVRMESPSGERSTGSTEKTMESWVSQQNNSEGDGIGHQDETITWTGEN
jgi:hypothetical protein